MSAPLWVGISESTEATRAIAAWLAPLLTQGDCLTLRGDLGAGKTEFSRALIRCLSDNDALEVTSPTFTLMQQYPITLQGGKAWCIHADLYRLEEESELVELGLDEALSEGLLVVEWPEIAVPHLPASRLDISIVMTPAGQRRIELWGDASWQLRLAALSATNTL